MQVQFNYTDLYAVVGRSLSIIAKRSTDDEGKPLFDNITLGSRETELVYDYFRSAVTGIATDLRKYVTAFTIDDTGFSMTVTLYGDANPQLEATILQAVKDYITSFALYSWFTVTAPRIYEKYLADANTFRGYLIAQVFHRQRPSSLPNPLAPKTDPSDT